MNYKLNTNIRVSIGIIGWLILVFCFLYVGAWFISPGSYSRAEIYELEISKDLLIQIIKEVKSENPDLDLPQITTPQGIYLEEGKHGKSDHWHHIYFYYPDKRQVIHTWVRQNTRTTTNFAFVGVDNGSTIGNWTNVNDSFWWWNNRPLKIEFEKRILEKIEAKIK